MLAAMETAVKMMNVQGSGPRRDGERHRIYVLCRQILVPGWENSWILVRF